MRTFPRTVRSLAVLAAPVLALGVLVPAAGAQQTRSGYEFELNDRGQDPRRTLELDLAGGSESMTLSITLDQKFSMDGALVREVALPVMVLDVELEIAPEPGDDGARLAAFTFGDLSFRPREGVPAELIPMLEQSLAGYDQVKGEMRVMPNGRPASIQVTNAADLTDGVRQSLDQTLNALRNSFAVFPDEPVGLGAQWTAVTTVEFPQFTMQQGSRYTLTEIDGDLVTLHVDMKQATPKNQSIDDAEGEWENTLTESAGAGEGTIILSLRSLAPVRTDVTFENRVEIDSVKGNRQSVTAVESTTKILTESEPR